MSAVWLVAKSHLRRRWRSLVVLALLTGFAGALVMTTVAGSRRTRTAVTRFEAEGGPIDAYVQLPVDDRGRVDRAHLTEVEGLPGVRAATAYSTIYLAPVTLDEALRSDFVAFASRDPRFSRIALPRMVVGRRPHADRVDELLVSEATADAADLEVGDTVRFLSLSQDQLLQAVSTGADTGQPVGPEGRLRVVGVARSPADLRPGFQDTYPAVVTPAFLARYRTRIGNFEGLVSVRLRDGRAGVEQFRRGVVAIYGSERDLEVEAARRPPSVQQAIDAEWLGLVLFGVVAAMAGFVAVAQALSRELGATAVDQSILRSVGLPQSSRRLAALAPAVPVAMLGALLAVIGAVAASPLMPIGIARKAEPDLGISLDALTLGLGALAVATAVLLVAGVVAWSIARSSPVPGAAPEAPGGARVSWVARSVGATAAPPPLAAGVRLALELGRGRTAIPTRPALAGMALGVAAIVAALTIGVSLDRLVSTPARYGWTWDVMIPTGSERARSTDLGRELERDREIGDVAIVDGGRIDINSQSVIGYGFEPIKGSIAPTIAEGRAPSGPDEVALGYDTMSALGVGIGDDVVVGQNRFDVVGSVVLPVLDDDEPASGAVFAGDLERFRSDPGSGYQVVLARFAPGVDEAAARSRLRRDGLDVVGVQRPRDVGALDELGYLPYLLASVLGVLGTVALAHALFLTIRRRQPDLAVLRTLGFVQGQVRTTIAWQASTIAMAGILVGVPFGLAAGRWLWLVLAEGIGVATDPLVPALPVVAVAAGALLVANLVAWVPATSAARTRPAVALRAE